MAGEKLSFSYDKEADVFYLSIGRPKKSVSREIDDGILLRFDPKNKKITGLTIINFQARFNKSRSRPIDVDLVANFKLA